MKKLMTMIAAVATAFGLFAAAPDIAGINSFDSNDAGIQDGKFTLPTTGWSFTGTDTEFALGEYNGDAYAYPTTTVAGNTRRTDFPSGTNAKYLKLETGKEVLSLATKSTSIFADQVVKFTGFEEAPELADNTKIAVWMSEEWNDDESEAVTNLYVSAYNAEEGVTNYLVGAANQYELGKWYRLTIKSLGNIMDSDLSARNGFVVYIDGELAASSEAELVITAASLKDDATRALAAAGQLFPAITDDTTFASVGYMGIGSVDDVVVDNQGPEFARSVDVSFAAISGATIAKVVDSKGNEFYNVSGTISVAQGNLTVTLAPAAGWKLAPGKGTYVVSTLAAKDGVITIPVEAGDVIEGYAQVVNAETPAVTNVYGEAELEDMIEALDDGDTVTFLQDSEIGDDSFGADTTIEVADGDWTITAVGELTLSSDIEKNIAITSEDDVYFASAIAAGYVVDATEVTGSFMLDDDIMVAGTLKVSDAFDNADCTITLGEAGKVWSAVKLDTSIFTNEVEEKQEDDGWAYTIKTEPETGFMVIIAAGGTKGPFETLAKAVEAAAAGDTIQLLDDQTVDGICEITKSLTLDLNGNTLSKADTTTAASKMIVVFNNATLTINGTTDGSAAVGGFYAGKKVGSTGNNGNIIVNGGTYSWPGAACVFSSNGKCTDSDITINNATVTSGADIALYFAGKGDYSIVNSAISGATAVYMKGGSLSVTGTSVLTANGEVDEAKINHNGANATGDAIVLDSALGYKGDISLEIGTGVQVTSTNGYAVRELITDAEADATLSIAVNSGATLSGELGELKVSDKFAEKVAAGQATVTGYVATVNGVAYKTAAEALLAVQALEVGDNYTIKVVVLADDTVVVNGNQQIVLDEGYAITITKNSWVFSSGVTINGTDPIALAEGATFTVVGQIAGYTALFSAPAGFSVKEIANGDGTYTYTTEKIKYHGNYEIWNAADFAQLQADVAAGETFAGKTFTLKPEAPITLEKWTGIGENTNGGSTAHPFAGTFNGNGAEITVKFNATKKYLGLFNLLANDAVVSNLTINASLDESTIDPMVKDFGFAALAGRVDAATIEKVTVKGSIGTTDKPATHNAAGMIVYLGGDNDAAFDTLIKDCVNEAKVFCSKDKVGGIVGFAGKGNKTFKNCVNKGDVTATGTASNGAGGLVGFYQFSGNMTFENCENTGAVTGEANSMIGSFVGKLNANVNFVIGTGANTARADILAVGKVAADTVSGFKYATVSSDVATFVADNALALNGSYKVMAPQATPTFEFTEAGTIAFDEALVAVKNFNGITAVAPLEVTPKTDGTVTTFTAAVPIPTFDITIAPTVNGKLETSVTNDVQAGTVVTVTATPDTDYELDTITTNGQAFAGKTFEMPAENVEIVATFKKAGPVYPSDWPETDPETKAKYVTWATTYAEQMKGLEKQALEEAFLLNCDPTTLAAEKAEFKITKIEKVNGEWEITVKSTNTKGVEFNGEVVTKAFEEVGCTTEVPIPAGTETKLFWKAFLDFPAAK